MPRCLSVASLFSVRAAACVLDCWAPAVLVRHCCVDRVTMSNEPSSLTNEPRETRITLTPPPSSSRAGSWFGERRRRRSAPGTVLRMGLAPRSPYQSRVTPNVGATPASPLALSSEEEARRALLFSAPASDDVSHDLSHAVSDRGTRDFELASKVGEESGYRTLANVVRSALRVQVAMHHDERLRTQQEHSLNSRVHVPWIKPCQELRLGRAACACAYSTFTFACARKLPARMLPAVATLTSPPFAP